jgi:hypothetical protein
VKIIKTKTAILRLIPNIITFPKLILQKKNITFSHYSLC